MTPFSLFLADSSKELVSHWQELFKDLPEGRFRAVHGDYFDHIISSAAMVSPANSFGIMDGGLDRAIRDTLGQQVEDRVQFMIRNHYHGEMPVGAAKVIRSGVGRWPYLVVAPTMRVPQDVSSTLNAYLAFRAILLCVRQHNYTHAYEDQIQSVLCPGLGTGVGKMTPHRCAQQMRQAYRQVMETDGGIPKFKAIHDTHLWMHTA